jgi:hypothetical protein
MKNSSHAKKVLYKKLVSRQLEQNEKLVVSNNNNDQIRMRPTVHYEAPRVALEDVNEKSVIDINDPLTLL